MKLAFLVTWIICGILAYGILFAFFQREFPTQACAMRRQDMGMASAMGLFFGPVALLIAFFVSGFCEHGLKFK